MLAKIVHILIALPYPDMPKIKQQHMENKRRHISTVSEHKFSIQRRLENKFNTSRETIKLNVFFKNRK